MGFILSQKQYDEVAQRKLEKVICYGGRSLTDIQSKYTITELELFACLHGITKLDSYLRGRKFILVTDHAPLKWLFNKELNNVKPRLARWIVALQMYNFEVRYTPGRLIPNVDFLSRQTYDNADEEIHFKNEPYLNSINNNLSTIDIQTQMIGDQLKQISIQDIRHAQKRDTWFNIMYTYLSYSRLPSTHELSKRVLRQYYDYVVIDKTLYHIYRAKNSVLEDTCQLCIPKEYRYHVIKAHHDQPDFGHFGPVKTLSTIQRRYFWQGMHADVASYIQGCITCAEANTSNPHKACLSSLPIPCQPMEVVHVDILALSTPSADYKYIVLIVDSFSKYCIGRALRHKTSKSVSRVLFDELFLKFGFPERFIIKSDNGMENLGSYAKALHALLKINRVLTTPYTPNSNGQVEIFNKTLLSLLRKHCHQNASKWSQYLPYAIFAMNSAISDTTKFSPIMLLHGINTRGVLDLQLPSIKQVVPKTLRDAHNYWKDRLKSIRSLAKDHQIVSKELQKKYHDKNIHPCDFKLLDQVFLKEPPSSPHVDPKLRKPFTGPWTITKILSPTNVYLTNEEGIQMKRSVHVNKLKLFRPRTHLRHELDRKIPVENPLQPRNDDDKKANDNTYPVGSPYSTQPLRRKFNDSGHTGQQYQRLMDNAPDESYFEEEKEEEDHHLKKHNDHQPNRVSTTKMTMRDKETIQSDRNVTEGSKTKTLLRGTADEDTTTSDEEQISKERTTRQATEAATTFPSDNKESGHEITDNSSEDEVIEKETLVPKSTMTGANCHRNDKDHDTESPEKDIEDNTESSDNDQEETNLQQGQLEPVNKVLRKRTGPSGTEYYVNWKNHPAKKINSWVTEQDMSDDLREKIKTRKLTESKPRLNTLIPIKKLTKYINSEEDRLSPHFILHTVRDIDGNVLENKHTCHQRYLDNLRVLLDREPNTKATYAIPNSPNLDDQYDDLKIHILYWTIKEVILQNDIVANKLEDTQGHYIQDNTDCVIPFYTTLLMIIREQNMREQGKNSTINLTLLNNPLNDLYQVQLKEKDADHVVYYIPSPVNNIIDRRSTCTLKRIRVPHPVIKRFVQWKDNIDVKSKP